MFDRPFVFGAPPLGLGEVMGSNIPIDLSGQRFGRLVALTRTTQKCGALNLTAWHCKCDCGNEKIIGTNSLRQGRSTSCGCYRNERVSAAKKTHGARGMPEYIVWKGMRARCLRKQNKSYANYGGRGITICERWSSFENFISDMGKRPAGTSLDRIDNNGNYEPGNCRWGTRLEQARNRRNVKPIEFGGETLFISEWAEKIGIDYSSMLERLGKWPLERALTSKKMKNACAFAGE